MWKTSNLSVCFRQMPNSVNVCFLDHGICIVFKTFDLTLLKVVKWVECFIPSPTFDLWNRTKYWSYIRQIFSLKNQPQLRWFIGSMKDPSGDLAVYCLSFIEMTQVLLNTIFATQSGNLELLFKFLRDLVPYTFAYNNMYYAGYLTTMLGECYN